jgi:hypothetical protein
MPPTDLDDTATGRPILQHDEGNGHTHRPAEWRERGAEFLPSAPRRKSVGLWRWRLSEISETTKVRLQMSAAGAVLIFAIMAGKYWGGWVADSTHTKEAVAAHEIRLSSLESRMAGIDKLLVEINAKQAEVSTNAAAAARFGSYSVDSLARMREALAERGLNVPDKGDD